MLIIGIESANGDTSLRLEMYERSRSQKTLYAMAKALKFKPYVIQSIAIF